MNNFGDRVSNLYRVDDFKNIRFESLERDIKRQNKSLAYMWWRFLADEDQQKSTRAMMNIEIVLEKKVEKA